MAPQDHAPERDADLVAAAQAAASWARARRATWTDAPVDFDLVTARPETVTRAAAIEPAPIEAPAPSVFEEPPPLFEEPRPAQPSIAARLAGMVREHGAQAARGLALLAVVGACGAAAVVAWPHVQSAISQLKARTAKAASTSPPPAEPPKTTGELQVHSTPPGAHVLVDGADRGVTPLTLAEVSPGRHLIVLKGETGTVERRVTVAVGRTATVDESIYAGWVAVYAPFELIIDENGRPLRPDEHDQIMLNPGAHDIRLTNRALAYQSTQHVEIKPGEVTTVRITPPASTLTVTAAAATDVWLDGTALGTTPITAVPVKVGTHEVVVRRGTTEARRLTVTIGVNPFVLNADVP